MERYHGCTLLASRVLPIWHRGNSSETTCELGQQRRISHVEVMSVLPPIPVELMTRGDAETATFRTKCRAAEHLSIRSPRRRGQSPTAARKGPEPWRFLG